MRSWTRDRRGWGLLPDPFDNLWSEEGEWHTEPDKVQWVDQETDLDCLAVRSRTGAWCGYVGVTKDHPYFSKPYQEIDDHIDVHGGLTFSNSCDEEAPEGYGVCHIPEPGRPGDVWWFGFDTNHCFDLAPRMWRLAAPEYRHLEYPEHDTYRTLRYVQGQVAGLAQQLKLAAQLADIVDATASYVCPTCGFHKDTPNHEHGCTEGMSEPVVIEVPGR